MKKLCTGLVAGLIIGVLLTSASGLMAASPIKLVINGKDIICDTPPQMINGRVMVPARFVAENLNASVSWDGTSQTVNIASNGAVSNTIQSTVRVNPDKAEFLALSKEADALIEEYGSKLNGSISESDSDSINTELKAMADKFNQWGELYPYPTIKTLYFATFKDLSLACFCKATSDADYDSWLSKFKIDKDKIQAEKTRLQKLGY